MADLIELFGGKLLGKDGEADTEAALKSKTAIALYFSGHWCPPCRGFTPQLADWYKNDLQAKGLEVIFVSSDKDDEAFKAYYGEMPWLALPYSEREKKEALSKKFKVNGIPSVVILGPDGKLITADGRAAISSDPTGEEMPWKPKTFKEVFDDAALLCPGDTKKKGSDLAGKVFGFYFSAHWCPPCRGFTPKLAEWYSTSLKEKGLEIVFVSSDKDEEAFSSYFGEQPWLALDFSDRKRKEQLSQLFGVSGIPSLVIIDKDGSVITKDGRSAIEGDPTGDEFRWYPKPVSNLKGGPGDVNEVTTVVAFCETSDKATQQAIEQAMESLATQMKTDAKAKGDENPQVAFLIVTENSGLAPRIRGMLSLPTLPPSKHEHPLEQKKGGGGWGCDGCGASGEGKERYRCAQGCDYDLCGDCNSKAGGVETLQPKLMILDIPDEGAYYEGPEGDVTAGTVQKLVDDYLAKSLERKQLS
jgi:nucleoredoxin